MPGTKVCAVCSGERFAEAVQHCSQLGARGRGLRRDGAAADAEDQLLRETQSTSVPGAVTCRSSPSSARTLS